MRRIDDEQAWFEAYMDTPFGIPDERVKRAHLRGDPDDLLDCPGVNLKSRERGASGFPMLFAKLVSYSDDEVVVRSKPDPLCDFAKCIWRGTPAEYARMWTVD